MSVKLDVDGLLYHNIPLKDVTKVEILNIMYSEPQKNRQCCDNLIKKETKKPKYTDNGVHAKIGPKLQNTSIIQLLRMILHEGVQKKYSRGFCQVSENLFRFYLNQGNSKKKWMDLEMKGRKIKRKGIEDHNKATMRNYR